MSRPLRIHLPGGFYHVTLRGNHQQAIFAIDADRLRLNEIVAAALERYAAQLHGYCWMTNHLHFLLRVGDVPLGVVMRQIASTYARAYQRKLETTGHLFERRYHARVVDAEAYLLQVLRYIHRNPVEAGLAKSPGQYRWSSHHAYAGRRVEPWLVTDFALRMLAARRDHAVAAFSRFLDCSEGDSSYPLDHVPPTPQDPLSRPPQAPPTARLEPHSLTALIEEACRRFETTLEQLYSDSRDLYLMQVRGWIVRRALVGKIANLSQIARALGRDRATLRHAMRRYPDEAC
jgi:REP element-mobilizing transposase RayT